jgi:hypothetical protein
VAFVEGLAEGGRSRRPRWRCVGRGGRQRGRIWSSVFPWQAETAKTEANVWYFLKSPMNIDHG